MAPQKESVQKMFDDISPKYDFLNHFLSFGTDILWRRKLVRMLSRKNPRKILDVATGTGDLAIAMAGIKPESIVGIDISHKMLAIGIKKIERKKLRSTISFREGDAEHIPFRNESFNAVTVAFGVRNFENLKKGLTEMKRVLRPGGIMMILEFSHPSAVPFKQLYGFYARYIIPFIGNLISRHSYAYTYLPESVDAFPSGEAFMEIMRETGVINCSRISLTFGIASLYMGEKPIK
jgi:demethylmenaquinone methyltransferase/2-methoxy-6-polyprenyl-1,4-benzoquinol methylase